MKFLCFLFGHKYTHIDRTGTVEYYDKCKRCGFTRLDNDGNKIYKIAKLYNSVSECLKY